MARYRKDFNFLPETMWQVREAKKRRMRLVLLSSLLGLAAGFSAYWPLRIEAELDKSIEQLTARYAVLEQGRAYQEKLARMENEYEKERKVVEGLKAGTVDVAELLDKIGMAVPPGVVINEMQFEMPNKVHLVCAVEGSLAGARFMAELQNLDCFAKVESKELPLAEEPMTVEFDLVLRSR